MTTYYNGLEVPGTQIDTFITTADGIGLFNLDLTYAPVSQQHIISLSQNIAGRFLRVTNLTGKTLQCLIYALLYNQAGISTGTGNSGSSGADPHSHTITLTSTSTTATLLANEPNIEVTVIYQPEGGS